VAGLRLRHWDIEREDSKVVSLVDLSTVADAEISNPPWVKFQSAGWVNFPSAPTHIGADDESGLVHSVVGTAANVADVTQVDKLLHGDENVVCADAGYTGVEKRPEHEGREVIWQVAARRSTYKKLDKRSVLYKAKRKIEKAKAQVRAKVEHPFRVIKRQFGYTKVRFRGLAKNTAQLVTLFALSNLWMARRHLLTNAGEVRL